MRAARDVAFNAGCRGRRNRFPSSLQNLTIWAFLPWFLGANATAFNGGFFNAEGNIECEERCLLFAIRHFGGDSMLRMSMF